MFQVHVQHSRFVDMGLTKNANRLKPYFSVTVVVLILFTTFYAMKWTVGNGYGSCYGTLLIHSICFQNFPLQFFLKNLPFTFRRWQIILKEENVVIPHWCILVKTILYFRIFNKFSKIHKVFVFYEYCSADRFSSFKALACPGWGSLIHDGNYFWNRSASVVWHVLRWNNFDCAIFGSLYVSIFC